MKLGRRKFLGLGSAALVGLSLKSEKKIAGSFVNDSFQIGHLLRDRAGFPAAKRTDSRTWRTQYMGSVISARAGLPVALEISSIFGSW